MRATPPAVLLVTAEPRLAAVVARALERGGCGSAWAATGPEAVRRLARDAPAAVLVDLAFPDMDPEQIVRRALACRETHGSPVVVLGPAGAVMESAVLLEGGCAAVLERDAEPGAIARAVLAALGRAAR
jgi:two-component system KDP operon response regulator KdpE